MLLCRITTFWRICGVLHSDVKYMDDELRVKPTPDQNPLLGRKINALYQLLTTREIQKTQPAVENAETKDSPKLSPKADSETLDLTVPTIQCDSPPDVSNFKPESITNDNEETNETLKTIEKQTKPYFENASMRLSLPLLVDPSQRLLIITLGDDFTHIWFPTWRKFLAAKRIQSCFLNAKKMNKAIEMTQTNNLPKVFVSNLHDNCIFIGPYGRTDRQNLALFVKHENHMMLSDVYYQDPNNKYTRKTKGNLTK